jgi:hypothetical protein
LVLVTRISHVLWMKAMFLNAMIRYSSFWWCVLGPILESGHGRCSRRVDKQYNVTQIELLISSYISLVNVMIQSFELTICLISIVTIMFLFLVNGVLVIRGFKILRLSIKLLLLAFNLEFLLDWNSLLCRIFVEISWMKRNNFNLWFRV